MYTPYDTSNNNDIEKNIVMYIRMIIQKNILFVKKS